MGERGGERNLEPLKNLFIKSASNLSVYVWWRSYLERTAIILDDYILSETSRAAFQRQIT